MVDVENNELYIGDIVYFVPPTGVNGRRLTKGIVYKVNNKTVDVDWVHYKYGKLKSNITRDKVLLFKRN